MSKKNKNVEKESFHQKRNINIEMPEVLNMDDIGYASDEAIIDRVRHLEVERNRVLDMRYDAQPWEVELAYLEREVQLRKTRSQKHDEFLRAFGYTATGEQDDDSSFDDNLQSSSTVLN
jgi:hypothetical protein